MTAILLDDNQRHPSFNSFRPIIHERNGRRRVRRTENLRFAGNEHIVQPTLKDYEPTIPSPRTTFPTPIPPFLSRANPSIPSVPRRDSITANAGRYSLSLKGIRKRLRRAGPKTEQTIFDIEEALTTWLHTGAVVIQPDIPFVPPLGTTRTYVDTCQSIQELSRSVLQLIWKVDDDFFRFLLHCVARFHGVVSYSKTISEVGGDVRVTYLLRPNTIRPDFRAPSYLETPPATDIDALSTPVDTDNSESDALSDTSDANEDFQEKKAVSVLPTVPEEDAVQVGFYAEADKEDNSVYEDDWSDRSEDSREQEDFGTRTGSHTRESRRNRVGIASRRWTLRSVSSPSRSPQRPSGRQSGLHYPLADKQRRFWHYIYG